MTMQAIGWAFRFLQNVGVCTQTVPLQAVYLSKAEVPVERSTRAPDKPKKQDSLVLQENTQFLLAVDS